MPLKRTYKKNAVIFFEDDKKSEEVFLIKSGKIHLKYSSPNDVLSQDVEMGTMFGIHSCLSGHPREETAQVQEECEVFVFTKEEFQIFLENKPKVCVRLLRRFSVELRNIGDQLTKLIDVKIGERLNESVESDLFNLGMFYLNSKRFSHAKYVFERYLETYPSGKHVEKAKTYWKNSGDKENEEDKMAMLYVQEDVEKTSTQDINHDASSEDTEKKNLKKTTKKKKLDDHGIQDKRSYNGDKYHETITYLKHGNYEKAVALYGELQASFSSMEKLDVANLEFEFGLGAFKAQEYDVAVQHLSQAIHMDPKHEKIAESLFALGRSHDFLKQYETALMFFNKLNSWSSESKEHYWKQESEGYIQKIQSKIKHKKDKGTKSS